MVYHVESDSGLHDVMWEGRGGKEAYLWQERRRRAPCTVNQAVRLR